MTIKITRDDDIFLWQVLQSIFRGSEVTKETIQKVREINARWANCTAADFTEGTIPIYCDIAGKLLTIAELMRGGDKDD